MARRKCAGFARISSAEREISKNKDLLAGAGGLEPENVAIASHSAAI
jgi:hypothetical protein